MPRGKNYVNQNTGMKLKGKEQVKELCFYGNACERKGCIYRHDRQTKVIEGNQPKSNDPCMAYLAGSCSFTDKTCRKYHPPTEEEVNMLIQKYQRIPCRFTIHCKTKGCLYMHPDANAYPINTINYIMPPLNQYNNRNAQRNPNLLDPNLFPPLQSQQQSSKESSVDATQQNNPVLSGSMSASLFEQQQQQQQQFRQPQQLYQEPNHNGMPSQQQQFNPENASSNQNPYCSFVPTASLRNATGSLIPTLPTNYRKQVPPKEQNLNQNESLNIQAKEFLPGGYTSSRS
jgi:hypothetical protein